MSKLPLEKRAKRFLARTISEDGKVNWKAVERYKATEFKYQESAPEAYELFLKYLVRKKILSPQKEGNFGLFVMHDVDYHPIQNKEGPLYFTKEEDALHYKELVDKNAIRVKKV